MTTANCYCSFKPGQKKSIDTKQEGKKLSFWRERVRERESDKLK